MAWVNQEFLRIFLFSMIVFCCRVTHGDFTETYLPNSSDDSSQLYRYRRERISVQQRKLSDGKPKWAKNKLCENINVNCFGFEECNTVETNESVKKVLESFTVVVMFTPRVAFVYCNNVVAPMRIQPKLWKTNH